MKEKVSNLVCIMCPVGCNLTIKQTENNISVTGNSCPRGHEYGIKEVTNPERIVTSVIKYKSGTITIKTSTSIPKNLVDNCLRYTKTLRLKENLKSGDIIAQNVFNTNANLVVTSVNL